MRSSLHSIGPVEPLDTAKFSQEEELALLRGDFFAPFACICHNVVESYARPSGVRRTHFTFSLSPLVTHVTLHAVGKSLNEKQKKVFI